MVGIIENLFEDGEWAILEWRDPKGLRGCGFFYVVNRKIVGQRGTGTSSPFSSVTACRRLRCQLDHYWELAVDLRE